MINHTYLLSHGNQIFCSFSSSNQNTGNIGVILVQPFAEERIIMQRASYNLGKELNQKEIPVCRFDFYGQGDSDGDSNDANIHEWQLNLHDVIQLFKKTFRLNNIVICGFRLGATLAMITAREADELKNLVLIDPVISGLNYIDNVLRSNLTYQMVTYGKVIENRDTLIRKLKSGHSVNVDGNLISSEFYKQLSTINLLQYEYKHKNVLVLHYSKSTARIHKKHIELCNHLRENGCQSVEKTIPDPTVWKASEIYNMNLSNTSNEIGFWIKKHLHNNSYTGTDYA